MSLINQKCLLVAYACPVSGGAGAGTKRCLQVWKRINAKLGLVDSFGLKRTRRAVMVWRTLDLYGTHSTFRQGNGGYPSIEIMRAWNAPYHVHPFLWEGTVYFGEGRWPDQHTIYGSILSIERKNDLMIFLCWYWCLFQDWFVWYRRLKDSAVKNTCSLCERILPERWNVYLWQILLLETIFP